MMSASGEQPAPLGAFHIEQEVMIDAPPARVFEALTQDVSMWWDAREMYDREAAHGVHLQPTLGGRFFEDWGNGEGVLYATVTHIKRPQWLRMSGSLGMGGAVAGVVDIRLMPVGNGTLLRLSHRAVGEVTEETRASYSGGWKRLLAECLKPYTERGVRSGWKR